MKIDIIIPVGTIDCDIREMTHMSILSLHDSSDKIEFNPIIIETFKKTKYKKASVYNFIQDKFNYNEALNFGFSKSTTEYVGFFNNDVFYGKNWAEKCIKHMREQKIYSCSPYCDRTVKRQSEDDVLIGYDIRTHVLGWAIFVKRDVVDKIGGFKTDVSFWYSDNIYTDQLKDNGIKHMVCYNAIVRHLENKTLNKIPQSERITQMHHQRKYYLRTKETNDYKFSIIMPSYLGKYKGNECSLDEKKDKLRRAIKSVINQSFKNWQLIIIADGCNNTIDVYQEFSDNSKIMCLYIEKQNSFAGYVRQAGIDKAKGELIIYLDSDDYYGKDHLKNVNKKFQNQWVYFDDYVNNRLRKVRKEINYIGTSCICHKRSLDVSWNGCNNYGHDWLFIQKLIKYKGEKINGGKYNVCHIPKILNI